MAPLAAHRRSPAFAMLLIVTIATGAPGCRSYKPEQVMLEADEMPHLPALEMVLDEDSYIRGFGDVRVVANPMQPMRTVPAAYIEGAYALVSRDLLKADLGAIDATGAKDEAGRSVPAEMLTIDAPVSQIQHVDDVYIYFRGVPPLRDKALVELLWTERALQGLEIMKRLLGSEFAHIEGGEHVGTLSIELTRHKQRKINTSYAVLVGLTLYVGALLGIPMRTDTVRVGMSATVRDKSGHEIARYEVEGKNTTGQALWWGYGPASTLRRPAHMALRDGLRKLQKELREDGPRLHSALAASRL